MCTWGEIIKRNNKFFVTILAIALVMLCLGSVSAVDDEKLNSTLETVNDISQDENIVIDEIANDGNADVASSKGETSSVSVAGEKQNKEILKASDDDILKSPSQAMTTTKPKTLLLQ